ncbi:MAG: sugar phosphate isomerase/epimerase [Spirochaetales bacterium]|nr:sugar phosphate isomerase/epimerase [Spirochaetales bacterium]
MKPATDRVRIGINLPKNPDPSAIRRRLRSFAECGYDSVEVSLDMLPLIVGGEKRPEYIEFFHSLLSEFDFEYSAHIGSGVDLRDEINLELQKKILYSSIEICTLMHLNPLVLHYEARTKDISIEKRFLELHREAADLAARYGVLLCIENIEVDLVDPVIDLVKSADRPNLRMTFDTGHAYLAAGFFHFDFLESLKRSLPFIGHLHLSDNTGDYERLRITNRQAYNAIPKTNRFAFGRGDAHLPPFWGSIPFDDVFSLLRDFRGIYVCEFHSDYFIPFGKSIQERVRSAIRLAGKPAG